MPVLRSETVDAASANARQHSSPHTQTGLLRDHGPSETFSGDEPTPTPPAPPPPLPPPYSNTHPRAPRPPNAPQGRKNGEGGEETGQGERDEPRRVTGQGRPRSPKTVQSAEGEQGKEKQERIMWLWLLEAPVRKIILQIHTPARSSQCWSRQTQHGLGVCIWMHLVNGTGNSPSPGQPTLE